VVDDDITFLDNYISIYKLYQGRFHQRKKHVVRWLQMSRSNLYSMKSEPRKEITSSLEENHLIVWFTSNEVNHMHDILQKTNDLRFVACAASRWRNSGEWNWVRREVTSWFWIVTVGSLWLSWGYTLWLCRNSYWKWPFIVSFPIKNGEKTLWVTGNLLQFAIEHGHRHSEFSHETRWCSIVM